MFHTDVNQCLLLSGLILFFVALFAFKIVEFELKYPQQCIKICGI